MLIAWILPVAVLAAGVPSTEPGPAVAVVAFGQCTEPGLAEAARSLRRELAARDQRILSEEATARPAGGLRAPSYEEVVRSIQAAEEDFFAQPPRLERAQATLRSALQEAGRLAPGAQRWQAFTTAAAQLARVLLKAGERARAREVFLAAVAVDPGLSLNKTEYPPSVQEELEVARELSGSIPHVELQVEGPAAGAPVFLNGFPAGNLPLSRRLPLGGYELVVGEPPRLSFRRELMLAADLSVHVDWEREARLHADAGPCFETASREQWLSASALLSSALGASQIVGVRHEGVGGERMLAATLVDVPRGRVVREGKVRAESRDGAHRLASFLLTGEEASGVEAAPLPDLSIAAAATAEAPQRPAWQRPFAGALAIAAAALAGVAVWQGIAEQEALREVQALRQPPHGYIPEGDVAKARGLLDQGGAARGWMIGTAIAAALLAGGAATAFFVKLDPPAGSPAAMPTASLAFAARF